MRSRKNKLKAILLNNKGETLLESLVSILLLSILILSITMMIKTALTITGNGIADAKARQDVYNELVAGKVPSKDGHLILRSKDNLKNIDVVIPVKIAERSSGSMNFKAFGFEGFGESTPDEEEP